jgi:hypothetical protein
MNLLGKGNKKVGRRVFVFNLPVFHSCPGASPVCRAVCYADKGHFRWPKNRDRYFLNWVASRRPGFADRVILELGRRQAKLVRVHSSGDFYSGEYIMRWGDTARTRPRRGRRLRRPGPGPHASPGALRPAEARSLS